MEDLKDVLKEAVSEISETPEENVEDIILLDNGDYIKKGLRYCGKCHEPKQKRISKGTLTGAIFPRCCDCKRKEIEQAEKKAKECFKEEQLSKRREYAYGKSDKRLNQTFENAELTDTRNFKIVKAYSEKFKENVNAGKCKNLLITGNVGVGKSYMATCICNYIINRWWARAYFTTIAEFSRKVWKSEDKDDAYYKIKTCHLLVIDDLGIDRNTDYMREILYNVIDARYNSGLPMIITTNLTPQQIFNPDDVMMKRCMSRLLENTILIDGNQTNNGEDLRLRKMRQNAQANIDELFK